MNNPMQMINQFIQFKNNFSGDPRAEVMRLVQSGKMSQAQLNNLQTQANAFMAMLDQLNK